MIQSFPWPLYIPEEFQRVYIQRLGFWTTLRPRPFLISSPIFCLAFVQQPISSLTYLNRFLAADTFDMLIGRVRIKGWEMHETVRFLDDIICKYLQLIKFEPNPKTAYSRSSKNTISCSNPIHRHINTRCRFSDIIRNFWPTLKPFKTTYSSCNLLRVWKFAHFLIFTPHPSIASRFPSSFNLGELAWIFSILTIAKT